MCIKKEKEMLFSEYKEMKKIATEIKNVAETQNKLINNLYKIIRKLKFLLFIALIIIIIFISILLFKTTQFHTDTTSSEQGNNNTVVTNNVLSNSSSININSNKKAHDTKGGS